MAKLIAYTDGACSENPGPGGYAAVINHSESCDTVQGYELDTTNNRMELRAVVECIKEVIKKRNEYIDECMDNETVLEIYSDSAYVVNTINKGWLLKWRMNGWKTTANEDVKNRDLWENLTLVMKKIKKLGVSVKMVKIKGHSGNTFNELVDKLAKEETQRAKQINAKKAGGVKHD